MGLVLMDYFRKVETQVRNVVLHKKILEIRQDSINNITTIFKLYLKSLEASVAATRTSGPSSISQSGNLAPCTVEGRGKVVEVLAMIDTGNDTASWVGHLERPVSRAEVGYGSSKATESQYRSEGSLHGDVGIYPRIGPKCRGDRSHL